uniref:Tripartite motif-containing protein 16-like n=1 Tax=Cyprinus carpio TaxID=7962 RepID=A0A8C1T0I6_CYPCA
MAKSCISVEQFSCPVCLDLLKDPVTIPCGHSYCKSCITDCWDQEDQKRVYSCPQCRQTFSPRPALARNTMLAEVVEKLKKTRLSADCDAGAGDCICVLCMDEHKNHETVSAAAQRTEKQRSAQTAVEDSERIFTELIRSIERSRSELIRLIRDQEKTAVSRAEERLERLEQEINDLRRRDAELEQLSHTQHHIQFLLQSLSVSECRHSTALHVTVSSQRTFDEVRRSVSVLRKEIEDFCKDEIEVISDKVLLPVLFPSDSYQLTLNLNTVNPLLGLSDGNRVIFQGDTNYGYPEHPDRFDYWEQVLCRKRVCGRSYWEVERSENGTVDVAVSYKNIRRKGEVKRKDCLFGYNDHSWSLCCSKYSGYSFTHNNIQTDLPLESISSRIGVFVDHSAGTLSFYSVSRNTMSLIHTVQTTFTQPLYPGFRVIYGTTMKLCNLSK